MSFYFQHIDTPLGLMTAVVNDDALLGLSFTDSKDYHTALKHFQKQARLIQISYHPIVNQIALEL
ncbi:methylated-DNA--[protein]-cysteine S-methyltransferase, partial [Staphylococcus pseudintermedius]|nr:methylated-DNA--[protein]-cysteine S-methyltransferase [Staphylococcus pseudintermedius]